MAASNRTYNATVSHDLCVGVGMCLQHAPGAFQFDDEGLSVFRPDGEWADDEVEEAASDCPMSAISLRRTADAADPPSGAGASG